MRVFIDAPLRGDQTLELPAAAARHVQVRRLQPGDALRLFNGQGGEWAATVQRIGRTQVVVQLGGFDSVEREMALPVTVALGMPANERMDFLVEKATELGVHAIQPLPAARRLLLSPDAAAPALRDVVCAGAKSWLTLSGPEGGLSPDEERTALAQGFQRVHLGPRILRAETAPLALLAWLGLRG